MQSRTIKTVYWLHLKVTKITHSSNANRAVTNCVTHMQINQYGSSVAQVYDDKTGELHAEIKRNIKGDIYISFKRDPCDFVTPSTLKHFKKMKENKKQS